MSNVTMGRSVYGSKVCALLGWPCIKSVTKTRASTSHRMSSCWGRRQRHLAFCPKPYVSLVNEIHSHQLTIELMNYTTLIARGSYVHDCCTWSWIIRHHCPLVFRFETSGNDLAKISRLFVQRNWVKSKPIGLNSRPRVIVAVIKYFLHGWNEANYHTGEQCHHQKVLQGLCQLDHDKW